MNKKFDINCLIKRIIPACLFILFTITILLMCSVPPVSRDALTHHLAVPKLYVEQGGIDELPNIIFSYYPQILDLIYCIPLMFKNDIAPKYIHFFFALLTAFFIYQYIKKRIGPLHAFISTLFFLSLPVIIKLSITVYIDLGLIFFSFASLLFLLKWREENFHIKWLILSAIFCGLALSTKYNGLITLFLLTLFTPLVYLHNNEKKNNTNFYSFVYGVIFFLIAILIFSPWMIKNYVWTKNPVYPLYDSFFNKSESTVLKPKLNHFQIRKYVYKESGWEIAATPIRIFFQGKENNPKYFDGILNPLLFFLPVLGLICIKNRQVQYTFGKKLLFLFSFFYIMAAFFQNDMRIRYIGPAIPPLIILSAYGLQNISQLAKKSLILSIIIYSLLLVFFSQNFIYLYKKFQQISPIEYISNKISRDDYIKKYWPEYSALQFANSNLKEDSKLLAFFLGNRRYYSNHDIDFKTEYYKEIIKNSTTAKEVLLKIKKQKYTNLIVNVDFTNKWIDTNFIDKEKTLIQTFFNTYTYQLFEKDGFRIYQLKG